MKFSIIVPVYNIEDKIFRCLSSIENQSFSDFEVLIIIDGATDGSKIICDEFEQRDRRFKVISKPNGGLVSARKYGAKFSTGEYIINVDGDDYVDEDYLMETKTIIEEFSPDIIAFGFKEISKNLCKYKNNISQGFYDERQILQMRESIIYDRNCKGFQGGFLINTIWTKVVRRVIYQKCQNLIPNHITVGEDLILNAYLMLEIHSLYVSNKSFYNYVISSESMMHKCNVDNFRHYIDVSTELKKISYINQDDINVYLFHAFISEIRKVAKSSDNYNLFKEIISKNEEIAKLHKYAKKANIERYDFEFIIKYILVKLSNWPLIYFVCKYS